MAVIIFKVCDVLEGILLHSILLFKFIKYVHIYGMAYDMHI